MERKTCVCPRAEQLFGLKALANEDTLLPTQMFPRLPARATFVADTNSVSGTQKMFLILFRNISCPQQYVSQFAQPVIKGDKGECKFCRRQQNL